MLYILEMSGPLCHPLVYMSAVFQGLNRMDEAMPTFEPLICWFILKERMK